MTSLCVRCERPMPDQAYACAGCRDRAVDQLHTIVDTTPAARDVAHGQARRGPGGAGSAEPRLPLNLGATQRLDAVQGTLGTWARHVAETRGGRPQAVRADPIVHAARYLAANAEWMRHRREVGEFLEDVEACARVVAGIARGPGEQKYLGPCGAERWPTEFDSDVRCPVDGEMVNLKCWNCGWVRREKPTPCEGDVYAYRGASKGRCKTCGGEVATSEREAWLDGEVRQHAFRAAHIADAYGVNVNTIRSWAARGQLVPHGRDAEDRPLFNVGEVLDLAAADAARRATEQAKRARRAAAREAAESEEAA